MVAIEAGGVGSDTVASLRAHIPRSVGVVGDAAVARALHRAGLPVILYTDEADIPGGVDDGIDVEPLTDPGPAMEVAGSLLDLIGGTPLVRLDRVGRDLSCHLMAKLEYLNPGGSVKDRPALRMIEAAESEGLLAPGGTIVEPTSGNTGVGLAIVAARRGYKCIFTMPDKIASEKMQLLRAYGAEVVVCPTSVAPDHPESYYSVARRLVASIPGAYQPNQYANPHNPEAHVLSTGPEIWRQTAGRITHLVASIGTGGTISGIGRYLKAQNPAIQVIGADPEGSVYSGGSGRPYLVEGIGEDFWPEAYDPSVVDRVVMVTDRDSFLTARRVSREEGVLVGGSCGTAVWAALHVARELGPEAVMVVILPDSGRGYLSKVYDDAWMADHGFLRAGGDTIDAVLARKGTGIPPLVHVHPYETVRAAIAILKEYGVSQMPVVDAEPPVVLAEVVGTVTDRHLLEAVLAEPSALDQPLRAVMDPPLPMIGVGEPVEVAAARLGERSAVLVLDGGHPTGIVTRSDLLDFLAGSPLAIHAGQDPEPTSGAVVVPISLASTFAQPAVGEFPLFDYARTGNPTRRALEVCLAALEGADHGVAFSSGMGAVDAVLHLLSPGDHLVLPLDAYGGTFRLVDKVYAPLGIAYTPVDLSDLDAVAAAWRPETKMVWTETPSNPLLGVVDIAALAAAAHDRGGRLVVDNTFATPYLQQPLAHGADIVVHSTTKWAGTATWSAASPPPRTRRWPSGWRSCRTRWAPCLPPSTATWCCAGPRPWPCAWTVTATTRRRSSGFCRGTPPWSGCCIRGWPTTPATPSPPARCAGSGGWCRSS